MSEHILLVEDEEKLARMVELELRYEGYEVEKAFDGRTGLERALSGAFDLILLDIMLPALSGMEVLRRLRRESQVPVIMLTARDTVVDKVSGLDSGADDYITKPFSTRELMARVKANIRRSAMLLSSTTAPGSGEQMIASGDLSINTDRYEVSKKGKLIELTQREYELLCFLASRPDKVFSRTSLMEQVWNYDYIGDARTVDVTVRRLREKIETNPANPVYILTRRGVGYFFSSQH